MTPDHGQFPDVLGVLRGKPLRSIVMHRGATCAVEPAALAILKEDTELASRPLPL
jgi:hypothetical protein